MKINASGILFLNHLFKCSPNYLIQTWVENFKNNYHHKNPLATEVRKRRMNCGIYLQEICNQPRRWDSSQEIVQMTSISVFKITKIN